MANEKRLIDAEAIARKLKNANCAECNVVRQVQCSACWVNDVLELLECDAVDAVVLPCKMGDMVYVITYCRCGNPECYDKQHCHKKETARTPKVLASKMVQQMGRKYNWKNFNERNWEWKPCGTICYRVYQKPFELKMLVEVGKTVFLSLEEAKQALSNCGAKMDGGNEDV